MKAVPALLKHLLISLTESLKHLVLELNTQSKMIPLHTNREVANTPVTKMSKPLIPRTKEVREKST